MRHEEETQSQEVNQVKARATRREEEENRQLSILPQHGMIAVVFPEEAKDKQGKKRGLMRDTFRGVSRH